MEENKLSKFSMWVTKDKYDIYGSLKLHWNKPERKYTYWDSENFLVVDHLPIDNNLFNNIKWEDEPTEIELFIKLLSEKSNRSN